MDPTSLSHPVPHRGMAKAGERLPAPRVSPWMVGGSWAALSRGTGWGDVVSWDGLTPRGHPADTFTEINSFQDSAQGVNFTGSKQKGICHVSAEIHTTQEVLLIVR